MEDRALYIFSTKTETNRGTGLSTGPPMSPPANATVIPAPMIPAPVSNQPTACTQYNLPPAPGPVHHAVISQTRAGPENSLPPVQAQTQHAGGDWGAPQQHAYTQSPPQHQMAQAQPVPAHGPNTTMSTPVGNRVSIRATKGQTSKYDDFVQQITLKKGTTHLMATTCTCWRTFGRSRRSTRPGHQTQPMSST